MATKLKFQAKSSVDGQLYPWLSDGLDFAGVGFTGPGTPLDVVQYSGPVGGVTLAPLTCSFAAPTSGALLPSGSPATVSVFVSRAATITISLGSTVIGTVSTGGAGVGSISWTPTYAQEGAGTLNAHAVGIPDGAVADAAGLPVTITMPTILVQAGNAQLFWMSKVSPGAVDGSPISALTNLSGSNAVFDAANNWGHGAVTLPNYAATGWGSREPAIAGDSGQGFRFTGSDLANCINGVGKSWHIAIVFEPVLLSGTTLVAGGFTASAGTQFGSGMTTWFANWGTPGTSPVFLLQSQAGNNVPDSQPIRNEPMIFEMWRPDATHVQIAINGVDSTPIAHASGTNFAGIDAITYGAWNNVSNNGLGNTQARYAGGTAHNIVPDRVALRAALKARFSGFDWQVGLGAT